MLETLFSNEKFFTSFAEQQEIQVFFEKAFVQVQSVDLCYLFRHLICVISPFELKRTIDLSKILSLLSTQTKHEIQIEYSIVISKLIASNVKSRLFLNGNQNFFLFSNLIQSASSKIVIEIFNDLLFTVPEDLDLFYNIILFYQWIFKDYC